MHTIRVSYESVIGKDPKFIKVGPYFYALLKDFVADKFVKGINLKYMEMHELYSVGASTLVRKTDIEDTFKSRDEIEEKYPELFLGV